MNGFLILFAVALIVSSIGFKKYVWFISIGYGFSVAAIGLVLLFLYGRSADAGLIIACVLFILYGLRLGGYLTYRETKKTSYNKKMKKEIKDGKGSTHVKLRPFCSDSKTEKELTDGS